ncbi:MULTISPECIES: glutamate synthase-related protein [unclassified Shinella]|uniref:glutamate synthase-related protein n=1 Tax=unclassified Shinella TaxID=2643062 RepID=UPI00225CA87E|nr:MULTISPECIES: glutamate synthase-related protein [unclassified Shinella]MCO5139705.1 glutamate synthase-related protein [Shinella sp.]MDC7258658.1 glutamate synthase large subunit [Shinella sp. YE25]CAI0335005.1 Glutamate synthase large subunit [Rhizobiaceae bacterium]CAK7260422.1 Glutamate synthase large subunit [Shinella sp. WSC3-e]
MDPREETFGLYDPSQEKSSCGVGFITRKDGKQTHDVLKKGHGALCAVPHRGGTSAEGVGDGAGVSVDISLGFFRKLTGRDDLQPRRFGVGNFFLPNDPVFRLEGERIIEDAFCAQGFPVLLTRDVPIDESAIRPAAIRHQQPIRQWVFGCHDEKASQAEFDVHIHRALLAIEARAYTEPQLAGLYPLSLSARTQVLKGRLNSNEVMPYFRDLVDPDHTVNTMYFHTRFSTNTDPHPSMAQPFRLMAHNGELNTDRKNRLSEAAIALARNASIIRPKGQSDSCRFDQTLQARVLEDGLDLVTAVVSMMPPAWENDDTLSPDVVAMLEYFSLYEEKNDGPAALIFGDGDIIGARLDRLGLRPLRTVETADYLCVMSEAGQIAFPPESVLRRGRIEAGGMLCYDHVQKRAFGTNEALEMLAARRPYRELLREARVTLAELPEIPAEAQGSPLRYNGDLERHQRYVAYSFNQESFKFLMDPMLQTGAEKISAMGYGNAINALSDQEGGVAKYFSQRFAQVTNPPLDSIREADGMTLRVALGAKPNIGAKAARQIVVPSPILTHLDMLRIREQAETPVKRFEMLYRPDLEDADANEAALEKAIDNLCEAIAAFAREEGGIAVVTDRHVARARAALPMILVVSAVNQKLIEEGLRLRLSLVVESGQIASSHHVAAVLGFGASAVYPLGVQFRAEEKFGGEADKAFKRFAKAAEKALMKTMGKVGLCTAESYIGGEFFEPNFLDTGDRVLKRYFPNVKTPVGGVNFKVIAAAVADWHAKALTVTREDDIPLLGLFKERAEGAGHSFGTAAVRGFVDMTEEKIGFESRQEDDDPFLRLLTLNRLDDAFGLDDAAYRNNGYEKLTPEAIDRFAITPGYRTFIRQMTEERARRPAALRDVLALPADVTYLSSAEDFRKEMGRFSRKGNNSFLVRGLACETLAGDTFRLTLTGGELARLAALGQSLVMRFGGDILGHWLEGGALMVQADGEARNYLALIRTAPDSIPLESVQPASEITPLLASGAMSHGALVANAHEAVAHGTNMVGGMSNSGEGGEHISRYGTIRASRIKQFASGRFGIWAGYLADPMLEELEIKIGQGAKPGEGGQLPAQKVTVEIAAARGGTPGVELVSPPPHHDTYSIEDLAQLIHDCKAARVRVIVKLVSSEGIGTIAVGVAKAGADVINVAGNTGGTGAAAVTSLKYTGRAAEIGIAEVHQALCANGLRQKVLLRCSGAHQTASDVVKSALLGGDSFEFGTTALMMLKCVMAKNCNIKCPAGLTTNPEVFDGDPRALAQYLLNIAHETREILAALGLSSLREARGRSDLLHLLDHPASVGQLDLRAMLAVVEEVKIADPVYMEKDFAVDDNFIELVRSALVDGRRADVELGGNRHLNNCNKTVGGQLAIDIERLLNHELTGEQARHLPAVRQDDRGRRFLDAGSVRIATSGSAGQSFGAFCNDGMALTHTGTCNDGVGKSANGGVIAVRSPGGGSDEAGGNVLVGNFALFGATGGRLFVEGQAGDRFAVRNSGATAVVEGVGDFCCEYMTNGAVLNLGTFGKGFGNGMSGGFVYQYDPYGDLPKKMSHDSILLGSIGDETEPMAAVHADTVRLLLEWHLAATGSRKARWLLENWESEKHNFVYGLPRALLLYQDSDAILKAKSRKDLVEELSTALAAHQVRKFKLAYRDRRAILNGAVPGYGETDTEGMFALLNNYTVLSMAQSIALARVPGARGPSDPAVEKAVRNLLLTEDFSLMQKLARYARDAIADYDDEALAVMVAAKRLDDYRQALKGRNTRAIDSPGTYGWILHQSARNIERIGRIPSFEELFARQAISGFAPARQ